MAEPARSRSVLSSLPRKLWVAAAASGCVLLIAGALYLLALAFTTLASLAFAILAALLLTTLLSPVAASLRRLRFPPALASLTTVIALLALLGGAIAFIWNRVSSEWDELRDTVATSVGRLRDYLVTGPLSLEPEQVDQASDTAAEQAQKAAPDPLSGVTVTLEVLGAAGLALILLFFFLKDGKTISRWLITRLPTSFQEKAERAGRNGWETLTRYLRGTLVVASVDAAGIGLALVVIGVPLALPLAVLTFLAAFIPLIGATVAGAAAVGVALVTEGPTAALLVLVAVIGVQQLEGNVLEPFIMGRALRLHPVVILVVISAGTLLGGIAGAAVAVPLTAVTYRVVQSLGSPAPIPAGGQRAVP